MPKPKWNLNSIYISERLQESLRPISHCALTTVVAPMGYGKTTAINWYLEQRAKAQSLHLIRINVYSDNLTIFWKSVQDAFARAGFSFLQDFTCPTDAASGGLLADELCHELKSEIACYIFIDDFHLLTDIRTSSFLCTLANRLPGNVHLIVASRDSFLPAAEMVRLGGKVYQIDTSHLRLNHTELAIYAHRCGTDLSDTQIETLLYSSEGWFSAIYLNLSTLSKYGELPDHNSDIYTMFTAAMIDPLSKKQREFLAVMGLADEFTAEMAYHITKDTETEEILSILTAQNAFVKRLPDGVTYRFHHMMKECAQRSFLTMKTETQKLYWERFGIWYARHKQYLHAIASYQKSENYDALLQVIQNDAGILLASLNPSDVLKMLNKCPTKTLKSHPFTILVLMRRMFTWHQIPKMLELKALLLTAVEEHPELSKEERGNLLGECDLIMSFLCYNDIRAMSHLHRSASNQMSRPAISIQNNGGWTFGSPSVLMMFYRAPGELQSELNEMDECMPHYYKITGNHGQGAETLMRAEAAYMQGHFTDAHIALESAYEQIEGNGQENMALCCDFLMRRLSLYVDVEQRYSFHERYVTLLRHHDSSCLNIWNATSAYYHALQNKTDKIPEIFSKHHLSNINMLAPGKPMMEMIENQVYLAQNAYAKVIGRSTKLLTLCEDMHYALVALHIQIQTAVAYEMLGKSEEAHKCLSKALFDATPDHFIMPFVENYDYLKLMLAREIKNEFIAKIIELGEVSKQRKSEVPRPPEFATLTKREFEVVNLIVQRLSNHEIAEKLFLSEGRVKQYVNQIYSKLHISGDTRTKRKQLTELFLQNQ